MTKGVQSAHPRRSRWDEGNEAMDEVEVGLTKREYFAAMAMQAMISNPFWDNSTPNMIGVEAVTQADALIEALNK